MLQVLLAKRPVDALILLRKWLREACRREGCKLDPALHFKSGDMRLQACFRSSCMSLLQLAARRARCPVGSIDSKLAATLGLCCAWRQLHFA